MKSVHKGWFILFIAVLNTLACLGLGRFSLGTIIPFMKEGLKLTYSEIGLVSSSVFFGYLLGAMLAGHFSIRFSAKKMVVFSLFITGGGMFASAVSFNFWSAYFSCFLIGIGAGIGNVSTLGLIGRWFAPAQRGMALGITNSGSGFGMLVSGFVVPFIIALSPNNGWRFNWYAMGAAVFLIVFINLLFLKNAPEEVSLEPIGKEKKEMNPLSQGKRVPQQASEEKNIYKNKTLWITGIVYMAWGFSYLMFSTFFVDYLMKEIHIDKSTAGQFFAFAGLASIISGFIWGNISDRIGRMPTLFIVLLIQSCLLIAFSLSNSSFLLFIETIAYSLTLWAVPTIMVAAVSDFIHPHNAPAAIGFLTLFFGIGQFTSPIVIGSLVDLSGSYFSAFLLSALVCFSSGLGCIKLYFAQKRPILKEVDF
jgi:MFS family permease